MGKLKKYQPALQANSSALYSEATNSEYDLDNFPISKIRVDLSKNIRDEKTGYNRARIKDLAMTLDSEGQLQPVTIRKMPNDDGTHTLIVGFRRFIAITEELKKTTIRVCFPEKKSIDIQSQIIENLEREGNTDYELGRGFFIMKSDYELTYEALSKKFSRPVTFIKNKVFLYELVNQHFSNNSPTSDFLKTITGSVASELRGLKLPELNKLVNKIQAYPEITIKEIRKEKETLANRKSKNPSANSKPNIKATIEQLRLEITRLEGKITKNLTKIKELESQL